MRERGRIVSDSLYRWGYTAKQASDDANRESDAVARREAEKDGSHAHAEHAEQEDGLSAVPIGDRAPEERCEQHGCWEHGCENAAVLAEATRVVARDAVASGASFLFGGASWSFSQLNASRDGGSDAVG